MTRADTQEPPRDFAALRSLIGARAGSLPRRLMQVASYALENPEEIAFGTAASIAGAAGVQPSTLVRFSQTLGYEGFSDLQEVFRARLRDRMPSYDERLNQMRQHGLTANTCDLLLEGFTSAASRSVAALRQQADSASLERAVGILAKAQTIHLVGLRRSFPVTVYLAYAMSKLGVRNVLTDGIAGLGPEQSSFIEPHDAMLAISFAPYASETVALAKAARARGASIVSISDTVLSPIAEIADCWLEIAEDNFEGFRSLAATMALAMTLAVAVAEHRRENGAG